MFLFHKPDQSPSYFAFAQTSTPTWGRFLTQVWPRQPNPLTLGYPRLQNLSRSLEKKLCIAKKCLDGWLNLIELFPGSAGLQFASLNTLMLVPADMQMGYI